MKINDLFTLLGETITELHVAPIDSKEFDHALSKAEFEAKLAKQMVNIADITLRSDKLVGRNDRIDKMIGD